MIISFRNTVINMLAVVHQLKMASSEMVVILCLDVV